VIAWNFIKRHPDLCAATFVAFAAGVAAVVFARMGM